MPKILKTAAMMDLRIVFNFFCLHDSLIRATQVQYCDVVPRTILEKSQILMKIAKNAKSGRRQSKIWSPHITATKLVFLENWIGQSF